MSASDAQETDGRTVPFIKFIALRSPPSSPRAMNVDNRVSVVRPPREGGTAVLKQNRVRERARCFRRSVLKDCYGSVYCAAWKEFSTMSIIVKFNLRQNIEERSGE